MDQRWRRNHDVFEGFPGYLPRSQAPPSTGTPLPPGVPPATPVDARAWQFEVHRLQQMLAEAKAVFAKQLSSASEAAHAQRARDLQASQVRLNELEHQLEQSKQRHQQELRSVRTQLDNARKSDQHKEDQLSKLKQEISNLAATAAAEQLQLRERHAALSTRYQSQLAETEAQLQRLKDSAEQKRRTLMHWQQAHRHAVALCEWQQLLRTGDRNRLQELGQELEQTRAEAQQAIASLNEQVESLDAMASMLQTDHEAVELICAELDHRVDEGQCLAEELQKEIGHLLDQANRERQESLRRIGSLESQLHSAACRLEIVSEEKQSLLESVSRLKQQARDYDASLFAKNQELEATQRQSEDACKQLEQLRCEHGTLAGQNDQLRNQVHELEGSRELLQEQLAETRQRLTESESSVTQRERQLREFQSAARAAEAHATLRLSEAEQEFAIETERLQEQLENQQAEVELQREQHAQAFAQLEEMRHSLATAQQSAAAVSSENDRLQEAIDQLREQLVESRQCVDQQADRVRYLETALEQQKADREASSGRLANLQQDLEACRQERARYANQVADLQQQVAGKDSRLASLEKLADDLRAQPAPSASAAPTENQLPSELEQEYQQRIVELERTNLTLRERNFQSSIAQQSEIESLRDQLRELCRQRDDLMRQADESADRADVLETQVQTLSQSVAELSEFENPIGEVKRLSGELSRQIATHARERESLIRRIEQLHAATTVRYAA
ncbi:hypothetical protein FYK55_01995 [Roseiconus nitratireducens]|uniref:Uncharacterized protein n=1 Tax=Roseiconus nitratireducens TaxID=2605748 RepID=A0A5M6DI14_9BACT|nr:hypothetical protein [Roseiconus nitratireducens]KAA5547198.1 hypothetical protein FYK55_01995 [Roseiconus nitratireducens]